MNAAEIEQWSKTWLYNIMTYGSWDDYPFVRNLSVEELAQLHKLLGRHIKEIEAWQDKLQKEAMATYYL